MISLLEKLNYKGQQRIAVINAGQYFDLAPWKELEKLTVDSQIDPRYPYDFMIIFVTKVSEVEKITPSALHNLSADGVLWFIYPKKTSKTFSSELERDHGWAVLNNAGFYGVRMVSVDQDWSGLRFRNVKYIKSTSERFRH
ncbi:MAG: hypothetical protein WCE64_16420 [Bacteroidales bacterium]